MEPSMIFKTVLVESERNRCSETSSDDDVLTRCVNAVWARIFQNAVKKKIRKSCEIKDYNSKSVSYRHQTWLQARNIKYRGKYYDCIREWPALKDITIWSEEAVAKFPTETVRKSIVACMAEVIESVGIKLEVDNKIKIW